MATNNQNINIIVKAINKSKNAFQGVEKSFNKLQFKADQTRQKLDKLKPTFTKMATVGTVAFAGLTAGIVKVTNKASDFEEATNKFNVVFKEVGNEADAMAKKLNDSYGLSLLKSKELLSGTGDLLTGFGFTGAKALDLASNVNTLAVDLASFTNAQGGAEAVSNALTKALLGETESLKTYGIAIRQSDVEAKLLEKGMKDLTGEALRQAKAQITLELAYAQSKNAIGDYERSAGSLAQSKKELAKTFEDLSVQLGTTFMPIVNDLIQTITPLIQKVATWVQENPKLARNIILVTTAVSGLVAVLGFLGLAMTAIAPLMVAVTLPMLATVGAVMLIVGAIVLLIAKWDLVKEGIFALSEAIYETWQNIANFFVKIFETIKGYFTSYFNFYKMIVMAVVNTIISIIETLKEAFKAVFEWITTNVFDPFIKTIEKVISKIQRAIDLAKRVGGNISAGIDVVTGKRASGGSVSAGKPYLVGEKGAEIFTPQSFGSITPNNQLAGAGNMTVVISNNSFMGDEDMAEKVGDRIVRILKDNTKM